MGNAGAEGEDSDQMDGQAGGPSSLTVSSSAIDRSSRQKQTVAATTTWMDSWNT